MGLEVGGKVADSDFGIFRLRKLPERQPATHIVAIPYIHSLIQSSQQPYSGSKTGLSLTFGVRMESVPRAQRLQFESGMSPKGSNAGSLVAACGATGKWNL